MRRIKYLRSMNERLASKSLYLLPHPHLIREIIFAILRVEPGPVTGEYSTDHLPAELRRTYYAKNIVSLLQGLGYFADGPQSNDWRAAQPTDEWYQLLEAEPYIRREMLYSTFENTFQAPDGSSVSEAMESIPRAPERIDWFMRKHGLAHSSAAYAERLYRKALAALDDAASTLQAFEAPLPKSTEPQAEDTPRTTSSTDAIRAVLRSHEHRSKGIELVFWLPDDADSSVYERIFQAADATIFSEEGRWEPFRDVDPSKVRLIEVNSDRGVPSRRIHHGVNPYGNDRHTSSEEKNATQS